MTRITFNRHAALALSLACGLLGLAAAATASAMSQASPVEIGQSFGVLGAITGLTAATLGVAWNRISRQSVGQ